MSGRYFKILFCIVKDAIYKTQLFVLVALLIGENFIKDNVDAEIN